jgi:hypothetical protein
MTLKLSDIKAGDYITPLPTCNASLFMEGTHYLVQQDRRGGLYVRFHDGNSDLDVYDMAQFQIVPQLSTLLERCKLDTADQIHAHVAKTRTLTTTFDFLAGHAQSWGFKLRKNESKVEFVGRVFHLIPELLKGVKDAYYEGWEGGAWSTNTIPDAGDWSVSDAHKLTQAHKP